MNRETLKNYAKLIATVGANVQPGQDVNIEAGIDQPEFIYMLVEQCYEAGARKVAVDFRYPELTKLHVAHQTPEALAEFAPWELEQWEHKVQTLPCRIYIESDDPDGLAGIDQEKYAKALQSKQRQIKPYRNRMDSKYQWCIAAVPGLKWAKKLFPDQDDETAMESLWVAILKAARALENPIENRRALNKQMQEKCKWLNSLGIAQLHYVDENGTDLTVGMMPESRFRGGGEKTLQGYAINANLPSEEVFASPKKGLAEGIVYSTMPLSYQSQLIENFSIRFEKGKAVEVHAEKNEELLKTLVTMDDGAGYLGECALVPYDSPISQGGLLFYSTLFDENASCHLALGSGYADTMAGFETMTLEECQAKGLNDSIIHVDFMIGSPTMNIDGITWDGKTIPIFRQGNWAK